MAPSQRARQNLRRIKAIKDKIVPNWLWKCPDCLKLCSKQKGGVEKHKRSCKAKQPEALDTSAPEESLPNSRTASASGSEPLLNNMDDSLDFPAATESLDLPSRRRNRGAQYASNEVTAALEQPSGRYRNEVA
ncbi:hypothetical protein FRC12_013225 [Ceratobasidium sp. 428]|nr:hypothetical protein FRC12_013225 [Ceratobasidium sp. 428]